MQLFYLIATLAMAAPAHAEKPKDVANPVIVISTAEDDDLKPSFTAVDGKAKSYSREVPTAEGFGSVRQGVWMAEPGEYRHPGGESAETFVVTHGRGKIQISGAGEYVLEPGVVVSLPAHTPAVMTVTEFIRKFAIHPAAK